MMSWLRTLANRDEDEGAFGRHAVLLASLVLLLVALPILQMAMGRVASFPPLLTLVMLAAVIVNSHQRGVFAIAAILGTVAVGGLVVAEASGAENAQVLGEIAALGLLGLTTLVMLNSLMYADRVSSDTIIGGICVYLLIGLCFAMAFITLAHVDAAAFASSGAPIAIEDPSRRATQLLYFSFVTLTTLGYGDIAPRTDLAQMFAVSETLIGQLYLTIFVARLVALFVGRKRNDPTV